MTKIAGRTVVEPTDEIRSELWKNIAFDVQGKSYLGNMIFKGEEEAATYAAEAVVEMREGREIGLITQNAVLLLFEEFSHIMQIPWAVQL